MSNANELLSRALEAYDHKEEPYFERLHQAFEEIRAFLAAEPEAEPRTSRIEVIYGVIRDCREERRSDLEIARRVVLLYGPPPNDAAEKEAEPVGYVYTDNGTKLKHGAIDDHLLENGTPLYTRPEPARKPMTLKERSEGYMELEKSIVLDAHLMSFLGGISAAEKHHGISEEA